VVKNRDLYKLIKKFVALIPDTIKIESSNGHFVCFSKGSLFVLGIKLFNRFQINITQLFNATNIFKQSYSNMLEKSFFLYIHFMQ